MIKTIIKRDGTKQPYDSDKINDWGQWMASQFNANWIPIVQKAEKRATAIADENNGEVRSAELQDILIDECLRLSTYEGYMMAGKLYGATLPKLIYGTKHHPTIRALHTQMIADGLLRDMGYSEAEYAHLESVIDHDLDLVTIHYSLDFIRHKYAIQNRVSGKEYETPQFVLMRMAMALCENEPPATRLALVERFYTNFSGKGDLVGFIPNKKLSSPSPNYTNLGTYSEAYASCCLYTIGDSIASLTAGQIITHEMTAASAGLGVNLRTRSEKDPVRGGAITHLGKYPYISALGKLALANKQGSRGGAMTLYFPILDPEVNLLTYLRNPRTPQARRNRDIHFSWMDNTFIAEKVAKNEDIFLANDFTAPKLMALFYSADYAGFKAEYERLEADPAFKKTYRNARELVLNAYAEGFHTGTFYYANASEINRHTPYKESIDSSNLCMEVMQPKTAYEHPKYLYMGEDHGKGEISTCNLGAINVSFLDLTPENEAKYEEAAYLALKMIDKTTELSKFPFEHLNYTSRQRMNASVGMMGVATLMARNNMRYDTPEGLVFIDRMAERHMYYLIRASLKIAKERGVAPWIHKTKWPEGWLPIDTYKKNVDELVPFELRYDWEALRQEIIANGGIGHSVLCAHMPGESSSKGLGATNSYYAIRDEVISKTDGMTTIRWAAYQEPGIEYQSAWDLSMMSMIHVTAVLQKWADSGISFDQHRPVPKAEKVSSTEVLESYFAMHRYGIKSRYYVNTNTHTDNSEEAALNVNSSLYSGPDVDEEFESIDFDDFGLDCDGCSV